MKGRESILVVDDDLDFLKIIKLILENKGYEVDTAPSANKGISRLIERFYNATILDISLPDADGTELLTKCLEIHPDIVAIMLTGHSSVQNAVQSLNRGAFAYLEKPLDTETLLSVINRGLEKQRLVLENRSLMEELEQRNKVSNTLLSVSQAVSESLDLQQIVDSSLEKVAYYTGIKISFIYLYENDRLVLKGTHGLSRNQVAKMEKEIQKDSGFIGRIFKQVKPIIVDDFMNSTDTSLEPLKKKGCRSFGGIPLSILGESIGVMGVVTSATDREITEIISNYSLESAERLLSLSEMPSFMRRPQAPKPYRNWTTCEPNFSPMYRTNCVLLWRLSRAPLTAFSSPMLFSMNQPASTSCNL